MVDWVLKSNNQSINQWLWVHILGDPQSVQARNATTTFRLEKEREREGMGEGQRVRERVRECV